MGPTALFSWGLGIFLGKVVDIFSAIVRIDKARNKGDARKLSYLFLNPLSVFAIGKWKPIGNWGGVHAKRQAVSGGDYWNHSPIWSRVNPSGTGGCYFYLNYDSHCVYGFSGSVRFVKQIESVDSSARTKIRAWLDSGANESMFKENPNIAKRIWSSNTRIGTANRGEEIGATQVGELDLQTKGGYVFQCFNEVIFSNRLRDNLVSVGKLCDSGNTVVFNSCGSKVYPNRGLIIQGKELHTEARDRKTGMYPITMLQGNFMTNCSVNLKQGELSDLVLIAEAILLKARGTNWKVQLPVLQLPSVATDEALAQLTRVYIKEDLDEATRWHAKCGHISMKYLKKLGIKNLEGKRLPETFRCESCIRAKIHRLPHKELHQQSKPKFLPGEMIAVDLMGPYARSLGGSRYGAIFKDYGSKYRWGYTMGTKTATDKAIVETLIDAKARAGRPCRFLKTDGDGIFRSNSFEDIRQAHQFVHEWAAPHDHDSNAEIERDIRTIFEGVATALESAGAPAYFWAEALHHFIFTQNNLPLISGTDDTGAVQLKSPACILNPGARPFNLNYLVGFGTMCTCYLPESERGRESAWAKEIISWSCGWLCSQHECIQSVGSGLQMPERGAYCFHLHS